MTTLPSSLPAEAQLMSSGGFNRHVGPFYQLPDAEGSAVKRYAFIAEKRHMNAAGSVHGGMLMTFMDVALSRTLRMATGAKSLGTVSLNCDFVSPAKLGDLVEAHARVVRAGRTMVFMSGELFANGETVLNATGLWRIVL